MDRPFEGGRGLDSGVLRAVSRAKAFERSEVALELDVVTLERSHVEWHACAPGRFDILERHVAAEIGSELLRREHVHQSDLELAWRECAYLIVPVADGKPGDPSAWFLPDGQSRFAPLEISIVE